MFPRPLPRGGLGIICIYLCRLVNIGIYIFIYIYTNEYMYVCIYISIYIYNQIFIL